MGVDSKQRVQSGQATRYGGTNEFVAHVFLELKLSYDWRWAEQGRGKFT